ncbi:MAG: hypothetical protein WCT29_02910 [Candidatus Paceibacterota bacterium]|jgi:ribosomal protein L37E
MDNRVPRNVVDMVEINCKNCGYSAHIVAAPKCPNCGWPFSKPIPKKTPPAEKKPKPQKLLGTSLKEKPQESRASLEERLTYLKRLGRKNKRNKKKEEDPKKQEEIKRIEAAIAKLDVETGAGARAEAVAPTQETQTENPELPSTPAPETATQIDEARKEREEALAQLRKTIDDANQIIIGNKNREQEILARLREIETGRARAPLVTAETENFSTDFIQDRILKLFASFEKVEKVKKVEVRGEGNRVSLDIIVTAKGEDIGIKADVENARGTLIAENLKIEAGILTRNYLKLKIKPKLEKIESLLREEVEKQTGKKVAGIKIENGQLNVNFEAQPLTVEGLETKGESGEEKQLREELAVIEKDTAQAKKDYQRALDALAATTEAATPETQQDTEKEEIEKQEEILEKAVEEVKDLQELLSALRSVDFVYNRSGEKSSTEDMARGIEKCLEVITDPSAKSPLPAEGIDYYLSHSNVTRRFEIRDKAKTFLLEIQESVFAEKENKAKAEEREKSLAQLNETIATINERVMRRNEDRQADDELIVRLEKELAELEGGSTGLLPSAEVEKRANEIDGEVETLWETLNKKIAEYNALGAFQIFAKLRLRDEIDRIREQQREKRWAQHQAWNEFHERRGVEQMEQEEAEKERQKKEEENGQERIQKIEEDKEINPFKYFALDKMSPEVFDIIFGEQKEAASLEILNKFGETGKELQFWQFNSFSPMQGYFVKFSSNGFLTQLQNPNEVTGEEEGKSVLYTESPKAKYKVITPGWKFIKDNLSYKEAQELMMRSAQEYQEKLLAEFEAENKQ